jgi:hypothetical protein
MASTVFYAWQSDRDETTNRFLIRDALKIAIKKIKADAKVQSAPPFELDHDTKGVTGHPHIADTIRRKIKSCGLFVADLTHVAEYTTADGRAKRAQNANVQIELGMAIRSKGFNKLILIMNDAYGPADDLPFDLKSHSFPITFTLNPGADKATIKQVTGLLADRIAGMLKPMLLAIHEEASAKLKAAEEAERKVEVTCQMAFAGVPGRGMSRFISITGVNCGSRPVTISQAGVVLSDGRMLIPAQTALFGPWKLPAKLEESDKVDVMADIQPLYDEMVKGRIAGKPLTVARVVMSDTQGRSYVSKQLEGFNEEELNPK